MNFVAPDVEPFRNLRRAAVQSLQGSPRDVIGQAVGQNQVWLRVSALGALQARLEADNLWG
eukprot:14209864-Alexandrium_andersonii.AAC.1